MNSPACRVVNNIASIMLDSIQADKRKRQPPSFREILSILVNR
jgi:hypothetical protein